MVEVDNSPQLPNMGNVEDLQTGVSTYVRAGGNNEGGGLIGCGIGFLGIGHNFRSFSWCEKWVEDVPGWRGNTAKDIDTLMSIVLSSCAYLVKPGFL